MTQLTGGLMAIDWILWLWSYTTHPSVGLAPIAAGVIILLSALRALWGYYSVADSMLLMVATLLSFSLPLQGGSGSPYVAVPLAFLVIFQAVLFFRFPWSLVVCSPLIAGTLVLALFFPTLYSRSDLLDQMALYIGLFVAGDRFTSFLLEATRQLDIAAQEADQSLLGSQVEREAALAAVRVQRVLHDEIISALRTISEATTVATQRRARADAARAAAALRSEFDLRGGSE